MARNPEFYLSLFAGCGGLDLAIRIARPNARCVGYVEREGSATKKLAARMADGSLDAAPVWSDVRSVPRDVYRGRVAGLAGGFPCQDLSVAGKQTGIRGERSGLFFAIPELVRDLGSVEWVFLENVPPVLAFPAGGTVLGELASLGFDAEWLSVRASDVGAPHQRKRVFILAYRNGMGTRRESGIFRSAQAAEQSEGLQRQRNGYPAGYGGVSVADAIGPEWRSHNERGRVSRGWLEGADGPRSASGEALDDTASARSERREPGSRGPLRNGARRPEPCGRCDAMADAEHAEWRAEHEEYSDTYRRNGFGRRGDSVGHADEPGPQGWSLCGCGCADERAVGAAGIAGVADSDSEGCGVGGQRDGEPIDREQSSRGRDAHGCDSELADTERQVFRGQSDTQVRRPFGRTSVDWNGASLPLFPPGPSDAAEWQRILEQWPHLAPAVESGFRVLADGMAMVVDEARTDQLRAGGNGVVALQGAVALTELMRRAGIKAARA